MLNSPCTGCGHIEKMHRHYHDRTYCGLSGCECSKYISRYFCLYKTVILLVALGLIMLWVVAMVRALT